MNQLVQPTTNKIPAHETERFQELVSGLYQCCQNRISHQSRAFNLPDAELRCLRLFALERHLTPKEIARHMGVVKSRITKIIEGLVGKGLIQRDKDPEDSRIRRLSLTPKGQAKLAAINRSLMVTNEKILSQLSSEQRQALLVHLKILKESMEGVE